MTAPDPNDIDAAQAAWEAECDAAWWDTCRHMAAAGLLGPDAWKEGT
jgi:hypothetical protein